MSYDFSGYATKVDIECSDGKTIRKGAFKDMDGKTVPLVWQHLADDPTNILGHAVLEYRDGDVYAYCSFNNTEKGQVSKEFVRHGDVKSLSIYANKLINKGKDVMHGVIREVSLCMAGANSGAMIDNIILEHADGSFGEDAESAIITFDQPITFGEEKVEHSEDKTEEADSTDDSIKMADGDTKDDETVEQVVASMSEKQQKVLVYMIEQALQGANIQHSDSEGNPDMSRNVFEGTDSAQTDTNATLSHAEVAEILTKAEKEGSLKDFMLQHADDYGIKDIEMLFPEARELNNPPDFIKRRTEWVAKVLGGASKTPFSRFRTTHADITADEARAKGYIKGNRKTEEVIKLLRRDVSPTTIYKKQKFDRDDLIDITSFDVVAWIRAEMRLMLEEEMARAILIGDGREADDPDHINDEKLKPIWTDDELYAPKVLVQPAEGEDLVDAFAEAAIRARKIYKGSGNPVLFTNEDFVTDMLLKKDKLGRRQYDNDGSVRSALRVSDIVEVEQFENLTRTNKDGKEVALLGILVNMSDYKIGADKGGETTMFDDFDIDFNQYKYLLETRASGMLTKVRSAVILECEVGLLETARVNAFEDEKIEI